MLAPAASSAGSNFAVASRSGYPAGMNGINAICFFARSCANVCSIDKRLFGITETPTQRDHKATTCMVKACRSAEGGSLVGGQMIQKLEQFRDQRYKRWQSVRVGVKHDYCKRKVAEALLEREVPINRNQRLESSGSGSQQHALHPSVPRPAA